MGELDSSAWWWNHALDGVVGGLIGGLVTAIAVVFTLRHEGRLSRDAAVANQKLAEEAAASERRLARELVAQETAVRLLSELHTFPRFLLGEGTDDPFAPGALRARFELPFWTLGLELQARARVSWPAFARFAHMLWADFRGFTRSKELDLGELGTWLDAAAEVVEDWLAWPEEVNERLSWAVGTWPDQWWKTQTWSRKQPSTDRT